MAIRILNPEPSPEVEKKALCRNCGIELAYVPMDRKDGKDTDYTGSTDHYSFITCPKCAAEVRVK